MSKACISSEEAEATRQHYQNMHVEALVEHGTNLNDNRFFVFRASDRKILKCVYYQPPNLDCLIAEAVADFASADEEAKEAKVSSDESTHGIDAGDAGDELPDLVSGTETEEEDEDEHASQSICKASAATLPTKQDVPTHVYTDNVLESVASFHRYFDAPVLGIPTLPNKNRIDLRISLMTEEAKELQVAFEQRSLVDVADALCDLQYVIAGSVLELGFGPNFKSLFEDLASDPSFYVNLLKSP